MIISSDNLDTELYEVQIKNKTIKQKMKVKELIKLTK